MDICVCGAQVPFTRGGAELHMENLVAALSAAGHRAELVRLPTAWDRDRVFDAALAWRMVPIDADLVIATNFPSYFVRHPRKVVWLFHQHRGVYDGVDAAVDRLRASTTRRSRPSGSGRVGHAGPSARPAACSRPPASSPTASPATTASSPSRCTTRRRCTTGCTPGRFGDYVFCATRLEAQQAPGPAGRGAGATSARDTRLRSPAPGRCGRAVGTARRLGSTDRLDLPGFVDDDALVERYAGALARRLRAVRRGLRLRHAPGLPRRQAGDHDDGLPAACSSGSRTASPASSPTAPRRRSADAIDRLAADPALARAHGRGRAARVEALSWGPVVDRLLGGDEGGAWSASSSTRIRRRHWPRRCGPCDLVPPLCHRPLGHGPRAAGGCVVGLVPDCRELGAVAAQGRLLAIWVDGPTALRRALDLDVAVAALVTSDPEVAALHRPVVHFPRAGIDLSTTPALAPMVRGRWRARLLLPDVLIVRVGDDRTSVSPDLVPTGLALASAVVARGRWWLLRGVGVGRTVVSPTPARRPPSGWATATATAS